MSDKRRDPDVGEDIAGEAASEIAEEEKESRDGNECERRALPDEAVAKLAGESRRADEMLALAQRLQADFDNYRKRTNETNKRVREEGRADVLEKLLPVLDAIDQARKMIDDESILGGIDIISRQLSELLGAFNVSKMEALGALFDPMMHNAVLSKETGDEDKGRVVEVYQEGYTLGDRVLRHAVVIVGK